MLRLRLQPKQAAAFRSRATELLYGGAAGGGKSHLMRAAFIAWCLDVPGLECFLFRRTYPDLMRNHMEGPSGLRAMLASLAELTAQEEAKQNRYKLSYYALALDDPQPLLKEVRARLEAEGIRANLVWSIDEAADCGLLDVLPAGASKLRALEFLCGKQDVDHAHAVFAGDSGNDLEVLAGPLMSVLVANASEDVREQAIELAAERGNAASLYLAHGEAGGMNGNYSAGILEGLAYFLPETRSWWD
jgi:hydroxymethylpyrimidine pyrophosphatase-like HAD family hydrolase